MEPIFRAKELKTGKWEKGSYVSFIDIANGDQHTTHAIINARGDWSFVDPRTLGQITPFKDITGIKYFEGDIRLVGGQDNWYIQIIEFHNTHETCGRGWIGRNLYKSNRYGDLIEKMDRFSYFDMPGGGVMLGNRYDNPEFFSNKPNA